MSTSDFPTLRPILESLPHIGPPPNRGTRIHGCLQNAQNMLIERLQVATRKEDIYVITVAFVLIAIFYHYGDMREFGPANTTLGAMMLARHLCGIGLPMPRTIWDGRGGVDVMNVIDRIIRNEHSKMPEEVYGAFKGSGPQLWELLHRLDEFYEGWREALGPVPRDVEEYWDGPLEEDYVEGEAERPKITLVDFPDTI